MEARFAEPTETEIVALLQKATPENTKKSTNYGDKILNGKFTKMKKCFKQLNILKHTLKHSYKTPVFVSQKPIIL